MADDNFFSGPFLLLDSENISPKQKTSGRLKSNLWSGSPAMAASSLGVKLLGEGDPIPELR